MIANPFLSFYTPSFRRPHHLAKCMRSVGQQTIPCEQIVIADHVGVGIGGMYAAVPRYAAAVHGLYVHFLADDDVLVAPDVVERVQAFAREHDNPDVMIVAALKNGMRYPLEAHGPPVAGRIDLGCVITRRDVWLHHVGDYAPIYEGDHAHMLAMWTAGRRFAYADILFEAGPASHGAAMDAPETVAAAGNWRGE